MVQYQVCTSRVGRHRSQADPIFGGSAKRCDVWSCPIGKLHFRMAKARRILSIVAFNRASWEQNILNSTTGSAEGTHITSYLSNPKRNSNTFFGSILEWLTLFTSHSCKNPFFIAYGLPIKKWIALIALKERREDGNAVY